MKILQYLTSSILILLFAVSCETDEDILYSLDNVPAPSNVSANFDITQDNTGWVTIYPAAEGATMYNVYFGDTIDETPSEFGVNEIIMHQYGEGVYTVKIEAVGINGLTADFSQEINVSFNPPENLEITIENDPSVSKQVNMSAKADNATVFDFYFGETAEEEPVVAMPDETVSHNYEEAGDYDIRVVARGAAIATLDSTFTFTVTEILQPTDAAPAPPALAAADVISVFSDAYTDIADTDFNPNWGQSTIVSTEEIAGSNVLKYANLNYQGTQFAAPVDASGMEFIHLDMWTVDAESVNFYPISSGPAEKAYALTIESGTWNSYDIPLTEFSDVVDLADIIQFKFDGTAGSTIFLDNIYFYTESGTPVEPELPLDFESTTINYAFENFGNVTTTVVDNPDASGINTSGKVAQSVKPSGAETWGGSYLTLPDPIDFSVNTTFKMKVWSPKSDIVVKLKVENLTDGNIAHEVDASTTTTNSWEELTYDFSGIDTGNSYQKVVIFFDFGNGGDDSNYYFDDIVLTN